LIDEQQYFFNLKQLGGMPDLKQSLMKDSVFLLWEERAEPNNHSDIYRINESIRRTNTDCIELVKMVDSRVQ